MKSTFLRSVLATLCVATMMVSANATTASAQDAKAVGQANDAFYAALNAMFKGDLKPMSDVWSNADDVTYLGPDGSFVVGQSEVFDNWQKQADMKLGGSVRPDKVHANVGQDIAVVANFEVGENIVDGKPQMVSIRATNVYRKENGQWKMIGHHTDMLPYLQQ